MVRRRAGPYAAAGWPGSLRRSAVQYRVEAALQRSNAEAGAHWRGVRDLQQGTTTLGNHPAGLLPLPFLP